MFAQANAELMNAFLGEHRHERPQHHAEHPVPENLAELKDALKSLDKLEAEILLRKYYYMQETRQIGAELGLSERAVEGRLYRIKKKMMKKMGGADHD